MKNVLENAEHKEGEVTKMIEDQTAKLPSDVFLWGSLAAIGVSLALKVAKKDSMSKFIGQWVAPILMLGLYNKVVKVAGHDHQDAA